MRDLILARRNYLESKRGSAHWPEFNAYVVNHYAVFCDKPSRLTKRNVETLGNYFCDLPPRSFYANPQDTKYFTSAELWIEQFVSYLKVECRGTRSLDHDAFSRTEIFKKALPEYGRGEECKPRIFTMLDTFEADEKLREVWYSLSKYTRPWSHLDADEALWLFRNGFAEDTVLACRDNAMGMFLWTRNVEFLKQLDKKDVVKQSLTEYGLCRELHFQPEIAERYRLMVANVRDCPLSKRQAKCYNAILRQVGEAQTADHSASPYRQAEAAMRRGDVVGAAQIFARHGSLLERNIIYLLSRANAAQTKRILSMFTEGNNPIVLAQIALGLSVGKDPRTFVFYRDGREMQHTETAEETEKRKSRLSPESINYLLATARDRLHETYDAKPKLGKLYLSEDLFRIALPLNTSASGKGIDVLPTGSRVPMRGDYVRVFAYWNDAFDIDLSAIMLRPDGKFRTMYWGNYSQNFFGDSALSSGDCRDRDGAEHCDFRVNELLELGYSYVIVTLNGFLDRLNEGTIYCGYQDKNDLNTDVWSPNNIAMQMRVVGDSREYAAFAVDLKRREIVVLNTIYAGEESVVAPRQIIAGAKRFLSTQYLKTFSMWDALAPRGVLVPSPEEADVVFDATYEGRPDQDVIRPHDVTRLVTFL